MRERSRKKRPRLSISAARKSPVLYFPPPVRRVDLPKDDGGTRLVGLVPEPDNATRSVQSDYRTLAPT